MVEPENDERTVNGNGGEDEARASPLSTAEVREYLKQASNQQELEELKGDLSLKGVPGGTIRGVISDMRKKGELFAGKGLKDVKMLQTAFPQKLGRYDVVTPEAVLEALALQDGDYKLGFKDGVLMLLLAARLNQELAATQASQMQPMISMLSAMRQEEKEAAERARGSTLEVAREAAAEAAQGVAEAISPAFENLKASVAASSPNPMASMMASAFQPALQQLVSQAMGGMMRVMTRHPGQSQPAPEEGSQPGQPGPQSGTIREATKDEVKEAFDE